MSTDRRTIKAYNVSAQEYHKHVNDPDASPLHEYYEKPAIRAALPPLDGLRVLSLGCGSGEDAAWIKQQGATAVLGIDISSELIKIAQATYPGVGFAVADLETYDYAVSSWDLVYSSLALHYVQDWTSLLKRIATSLKPGGRLVFSANHPLETALESFTAQGSRGMRLGRSIDNATAKREIWGDYLALASGGIRKRQSTVANDQVVYSYHRTISSLLHSVRESGLAMIDFIEPIPQAQMQTANAEHYRQVRALPKFFVCVLEKPISQ